MKWEKRGKKEAVQRQILNYLNVTPKVHTQRFFSLKFLSYFMFLKPIPDTGNTQSDTLNREASVC